MRPRILFVDHTGKLGGGELSLLDIARHFRSTSDVVLFEEGPFRERLVQEGVNVDILPMGGTVRRVSRGGGPLQDVTAVPGVLRGAWHLSRKAMAYDLLYANSQKSMIVAAVAGQLARKPVLWHLRDLMTADHFSRFHCRMVAALSNLLITRVLANSRATRDAFIACGGESRRVFTVHNGVDHEPFTQVTPQKVEHLRDQLGLNGAPIVGIFSRVAHWKGHHVLIDALKELSGVHAIVVGDALFEGDMRYSNELKRKVNQLGLANRIHFLGFRQDIPQLMHAVDIVVHTSIAPEPFGRVLVEGMLAGKPVVATRAGGALEVIEEAETGCLVPADDSAALAYVLNRLLSEPDAAHELARSGQQMALSQFSLQAMLEKVGTHVGQVAHCCRAVKRR